MNFLFIKVKITSLIYHQQHFNLCSIFPLAPFIMHKNALYTFNHNYLGDLIMGVDGTPESVEPIPGTFRCPRETS